MLRAIRQNLKSAIIHAKGDIPKSGIDFFVLGATRCGTTYLHHCLNSHEDIFMPRYKELNYFNSDRLYKDDLKGYRIMFNGYKGQCLVGEATPLYFEKGTHYKDRGKLDFFREETAIARIAKHFPKTKLIISLRDPLSRIRSLHSKNYLQGKITTTLAEEIDNEFKGQSRLKLLFRNRYDIHLKEVFLHFPKEAVHIILFEEWIQNVPNALNDISSFLGIAQRKEWPKMKDKKNKSSEYAKTSDLTSANTPTEMDEQLIELIKRELNPSKVYLEELLQKELPWKTFQ